MGKIEHTPWQIIEHTLENAHMKLEAHDEHPYANDCDAAIDLLDTLQQRNAALVTALEAIRDAAPSASNAQFLDIHALLANGGGDE